MQYTALHCMYQELDEVRGEGDSRAEPGVA